MKELDSFTVEQLTEFIESDHAQCVDVSALARIALAAKRAEPEWYVVITSVGVWQARYKTRGEAENHIKPWNKDYWIKELYTTPQLNSPVIPEGWISCSDRMPTQKQTNRYISLNLAINNRTVVQGGFDDGRFWLEGREISGVTHWMPLPTAPEKPL